MHFGYTPLSIPYIVSGITALVMAVVAWKHRGRPGATALCWLTLATAEWSLGNAMELCSVELEAKLLWSNIEYAGITTVPVAWFATALGLSGKGEWLTRRNTLLLLIMPAITQAMVWTSGHHELMRYNIRLDTSGPVALIAKAYGPWFWIWTAYSYTLLAIATVRVIRATFGLPGPYRAQSKLVAVGAITPWAASVLYISGLSPLHGLDITPIAFLATGLAGALAILRYRLFDIRPIAWSTIVGDMDDGIIVTNFEGRIVAINPAAQAFTDQSADRVVGGGAADVIARWPLAARALSELTESSGESSLEIADEDVFLEFRLWPLLGPGRSILGKIIAIRDVTERQRTHAELVEQHRALAAMEERATLAQDLHDDICQVLGYLNVRLQSAQAKLAGEQTAAVESDLENLIDVVRDAQAEVRSYIRGMIGEALPEREFVPRLRELLRDVESRYGVCTTLIVPRGLSEGFVGHAVELQLFRIIQEAATNAGKHADARNLWVSLKLSRAYAEAVVRDDGKGFSVADGAASPSSGGCGIGIMRERADRLGGDLALRSAPGEGTEVRVCIPLKSKFNEGD